MEGREGDLSKRTSKEVETCFPLNEYLHVQTECFAYKYDMKPKDVFRKFFIFGLKCYRALERDEPNIFLVEEDGRESPLIPFPECMHEEIPDSKEPVMTEVRLDLRKRERIKLSRIAKRNNLSDWKVLENFIEFGLHIVDLLEEPNSRVVFRSKRGQEEDLSSSLPEINRKKKK